ncbi:hypothetical protein [Ensifer adhaerens]|uniref:hypothetical protein n=1 Tax=Ensifer adhaerens TaxID=106592 RepID=UPI00098F0465|nr:hypothetical protein [Ensifer adhaerens]
MSAEGQTIPDDIRDIAKATAEALIGRMCTTMDHSFGLQNEQQQRGLKTSMSQLVEHDIAPAMAKALHEERQRCASVARDATMMTGAPIQEMGDEVAAAVLSQPKAVKFWMVYGLGQRGSTYQHPSKSSARKEAKRLASLHPDIPFVVLAAVDAYRTDAPVMQRIKITKPDPADTFGDDGIPF